ncbi:MAG TPA: hypothetical protein VK504_03425, partial [Vicinamibacterales bacterium]|nr:hypothetical protein [Vicinamibacterales bacterium]
MVERQRDPIAADAIELIAARQAIWLAIAKASSPVLIRDEVGVVGNSREIVREEISQVVQLIEDSASCLVAFVAENATRLLIELLFQHTRPSQPKRRRFPSRRSGQSARQCATWGRLAEPVDEQEARALRETAGDR